jgi:hypothetical protein
MLARHDSAVEPFLEATDLSLEHAAIRKLEKTYSFSSRARYHRSEWSQQARDDKRRQRITA